MPNFQHLAGGRLKYLVRRRYERAGFVCLQTDGRSWDIVALGDYPDVRLIQVKRVADKATARRLIRQFKARPPKPDGYHRIMEVYVSDTRERLSSDRGL